MNKVKLKNDSGDSSKCVFNAIHHSNNSNIEGFTGGNFGRNIQGVDTKSDVGSPGTEDTEYLVEIFGISAVDGFVALKIISAVF